MRVVAALCAVAGLLALPAAGAAPSEATLLGLERDPVTKQLSLVELDAATLARAGASLRLPDVIVPTWSESPDTRSLALGPWDSPRIPLVQRQGLRLVREVALPKARYARQLAWVARNRLLALVGSCCGPETAVAVVDPQRGRVVRSRAVPGRVVASAVWPGGIVLVLRRAGIGPARLATAGADGSLRTVALPRTRAGRRGVAGEPYSSVQRVPGLAVDPERGRAYVLGADEPVAEVDLHTLRVRYHALAPARELQARTKTVDGPSRRAAWLGEGVLALAGWNARGLAGGGSRLEPAGVHVVDTRTWRKRTLAADARDFAAAGGSVVVSQTPGLAVYGRDGAERVRVGGAFSWVQAAGGRAYAWRETGEMLVVDLAAGTSAPVRLASPPTVLGP